MTGHQFSSRLKEDMEGLLEQKHALGSPYIVRNCRKIKCTI